MIADGVPENSCDGCSEDPIRADISRTEERLESFFAPSASFFFLTGSVVLDGRLLSGLTFCVTKQSTKKKKNVAKETEKLTSEKCVYN